MLGKIGSLPALILCGGIVMASEAEAQSGEPFPVGKTKADQERNAALLGGYDYSKYNTSITGYTGQDLQRVAFVRYEEAVRTRVGPRGNYKAGFSRLADGKLVIAVCREEPGYKADQSKRFFNIFVYESLDEGLTWVEIAKPGIIGKEPSLTALPDGAILLTAQHADFRPDAKRGDMYVCRSEDGGRTWQISKVPGGGYPRNVIVEQDDSLLWMRRKGNNLELCRSTDGGRAWQFSEGLVPWDPKDVANFDEVSAVRLDDGAILASLRHEIPGAPGEGFEDTMIARSTDDGKTWSKPERFTNTAEVHVYLTKLSDGRILATYSNYHLPYASCAMLSSDGGRTWDRDNVVLLSLSADLYVGWAVTLQMPDGSLMTSYAITSYLKEPPSTTTCEVVRWRLPE